MTTRETTQQTKTNLAAVSSSELTMIVKIPYLEDTFSGAEWKTDKSTGFEIMQTMAPSASPVIYRLSTHAQVTEQWCICFLSN